MLDSILSSTLTISGVLICTGVSLVFGLAISAIYMFRNTYTKSFAITLVLLPAVVQAVIMLVNGELGVGLAVAGAFSLVRFRSAPGTGREISAIFTAMAIGLATGMGYIGYAAIFLALVGAVMLVLQITKFGEKSGAEKDLRITIPEDLDYNGVFDDIFSEYTTHSELFKVKTSNFGSLYELQYHVTLKDTAKEKEFLDKLRCRNGNLNIVCGRIARAVEEL